MIELGFGEGIAGSLKAAKSLKHGNSKSGVNASIEGSSKDVEALTLILDIGDISDIDTGMNARKKLIDVMYADFPVVPDEIWKTNQHALARLHEAKTTLEPVRMWICESDPAELCGLYFICHLMADAQTPLSVVLVPSHIEKENGIISYRSTGEICPEALGAFIRYEEPVSNLKRSVYANIWNDFMRENAPLRVVINGSLKGVPEDFYDFALRANITDGELKVAYLLGKTLGQTPGVGDRWLFLRMQAMLKSGELILVSEAEGDHPYSGLVKRNTEFII